MTQDIPPSRPLAEQTGADFAALVAVMRRLLAPDGCPWDREQTFDSLRKYVLEEACEVIDAIDEDDRAHLCEELGDLALQVAFLAELGRSEQSFGPDDVMRGICEKLVRRHPHVFGDVTVRDAEQVLENWQRIKETEKPKPRLLERVPRSLPGLVRAQRIGEKVAKVGFDWPDPAGSFAKVEEELGELRAATAAGAPAAIQEEFGDVLFALVNYARHLGLDAEAALKQTCTKFERRFSHVEDRVRERYGDFPEKGAPKLSLEELDGYWEEGKGRSG